MTVEWVDVEEPPAPPPDPRRSPGRGRRLPGGVAAVAVAAIVAVLVVLAGGPGDTIAGRGSAGPPAGPLPSGVLENPDDETGGALVLGNAYSSGLSPDTHEIVYLIPLRNTRRAPVHVVAIGIRVPPAQRHEVIGASIVGGTLLSFSDAPPPPLHAIGPQQTVFAWIGLRYRCSPHGRAVAPRVSVTVRTDVGDVVSIGPDEGLVAPNDPALSAGCNASLR